jgi:hypothetical protein
LPYLDLLTGLAMRGPLLGVLLQKTLPFSRTAQSRPGAMFSDTFPRDRIGLEDSRQRSLELQVHEAAVRLTLSHVAAVL